MRACGSAWIVPCMSAWIDACVRACVRACMCVDRFVCVCVHTRVRACVDHSVRVCGWLRACVNRCVHAWVRAWVGACMGGCMHGWVHEWMGGWTSGCVRVCVGACVDRSVVTGDTMRTGSAQVYLPACCSWHVPSSFMKHTTCSLSVVFFLLREETCHQNAIAQTLQVRVLSQITMIQLRVMLAPRKVVAPPPPRSLL